MSNEFSAKKKTGRPRVESEAVNVRMERALLGAIDAWILQQDDPAIGRPEAVRRLVEEALKEKPISQQQG